MNTSVKRLSFSLTLVLNCEPVIKELWAVTTDTAHIDKTLLEKINHWLDSPVTNGSAFIAPIYSRISKMDYLMARSLKYAQDRPSMIGDERGMIQLALRKATRSALLNTDERQIFARLLAEIESLT